jgi:hypothetical protein
MGKEKATMQPCDELKNMVLHHYGKSASSTQADAIEEIYSLQEGVTIIGNDPNEWLDDRDSIVAFMNAGSSSKVAIAVRNLRAYSEGSVGWTIDRVTVKLPNGAELPVRHTRILYKENSVRKMVHLYVSIAVPNESIEG